MLAGLSTCLTSHDEGSMYLATGAALYAVRSFASGGTMDHYDSVATWNDLYATREEFQVAGIGTREETSAARRAFVSASIANLADFAASRWTPQDRGGGDPGMCIGAIISFAASCGVRDAVVASMGGDSLAELLDNVRRDVEDASR